MVILNNLGNHEKTLWKWINAKLESCYIPGSGIYNDPLFGVPYIKTKDCIGSGVNICIQIVLVGWIFSINRDFWKVCQNVKIHILKKNNPGLTGQFHFAKPLKGTQVCLLMLMKGALFLVAMIIFLTGIK